MGIGLINVEAKKIEACDRWLHCKLVCTCNYDGRRFVAWSLAAQRSLHSACGSRAGVRLPILPVCIYTSGGSKFVYDLLDSGSEKSLIS